MVLHSEIDIHEFNSEKNKISDTPHTFCNIGIYISDHISKTSNKVIHDERFKLYALRNTFATYYYWTKDIKNVAHRLGHNKTDRIDHNIRIYNDLKIQLCRKSNLFDQAIRQFKNGRKFGK